MPRGVPRPCPRAPGRCRPEGRNGRAGERDRPTRSGPGSAEAPLPAGPGPGRSRRSDVPRWGSSPSGRSQRSSTSQTASRRSRPFREPPSPPVSPAASARRPAQGRREPHSALPHAAAERPFGRPGAGWRLVSTVAPARPRGGRSHRPGSPCRLRARPWSVRAPRYLRVRAGSAPAGDPGLLSGLRRPSVLSRRRTQPSGGAGTGGSTTWRLLMLPGSLSRAASMVGGVVASIVSGMSAPPGDGWWVPGYLLSILHQSPW